MHPLRAFFNGLWPVSDRDFARLLPHVEPLAVAKGAHLLEAG